MPGGKELPRQKTVDKSLGPQYKLPGVRGGLGAVQTPSAAVRAVHLSPAQNKQRDLCPDCSALQTGAERLFCVEKTGMPLRFARRSSLCVLRGGYSGETKLNPPCRLCPSGGAAAGALRLRPFRPGCLRQPGCPPKLRPGGDPHRGLCHGARLGGRPVHRRRFGGGGASPI